MATNQKSDKKQDAKAGDKKAPAKSASSQGNKSDSKKK